MDRCLPGGDELKSLAALFSGGKDSTYAIYKVEETGFRVDLLLTVYPSSPDSLYFHYPNIKLTELQAEAMRKKHVTMKAGDDELKILRSLIEKISREVDGIVLGVSSSTFQKNAVEKLCREYGLDLHTPLWGMDPSKLLEDIVESGFQVIVTGVAALGLGREWLGRILSKEEIDELKEISRRYGVNISGEGGEMETIVLDSPIFKEKIEILDYEIEWKMDRGFFIIKKARLKEKAILL
ncbi:MAG: diphthine--ammonia ligase [Nitrososphaerota archaeon]